MATDDPIRASDSDREVVAAALRDAYAAGRLTMQEFDERTTAAYTARTWGDLRKLTIDLPAQPVLGADVPGRRSWSSAAQSAGDQPPSGQFPLAPVPARPSRNNLPPRPPVRRPRPGVLVIPLLVWLLLITYTSAGTAGPIAIAVAALLVAALLTAIRRH